MSEAILKLPEGPLRASWGTGHGAFSGPLGGRLGASCEPLGALMGPIGAEGSKCLCGFLAWALL
eukprot:1715291-Pyramimonas_sp.AAC.1